MANYSFDKYTKSLNVGSTVNTVVTYLRPDPNYVVHSEDFYVNTLPTGVTSIEFDDTYVAGEPENNVSVEITFDPSFTVSSSNSNLALGIEGDARLYKASDSKTSVLNFHINLLTQLSGCSVVNNATSGVSLIDDALVGTVLPNENKQLVSCVITADAGNYFEKPVSVNYSRGIEEKVKLVERDLDGNIVSYTLDFFYKNNVDTFIGDNLNIDIATSASVIVSEGKIIKAVDFGSDNININGEFKNIKVIGTVGSEFDIRICRKQDLLDVQTGHQGFGLIIPNVLSHDYLKYYTAQGSNPQYYFPEDIVVGTRIYSIPGNGLILPEGGAEVINVAPDNIWIQLDVDAEVTSYGYQQGEFTYYPTSNDILNVQGVEIVNQDGTNTSNTYDINGVVVNGINVDFPATSNYVTNDYAGNQKAHSFYGLFIDPSGGTTLNSNIVTQNNLPRYLISQLANPKVVMVLNKSNAGNGLVFSEEVISGYGRPDKLTKELSHIPNLNSRLSIDYTHTVPSGTFTLDRQPYYSKLVKNGVVLQSDIDAGDQKFHVDISNIPSSSTTPTLNDVSPAVFVSAYGGDLHDELLFNGTTIPLHVVDSSGFIQTFKQSFGLQPLEAGSYKVTIVSGDLGPKQHLVGYNNGGSVADFDFEVIKLEATQVDAQSINFKMIVDVVRWGIVDPIQSSYPYLPIMLDVNQFTTYTP